MKNSNYFETPKGYLSRSENASEVQIYRAETNASAFLTIRLLSKPQITSDITSNIRIYCARTSGNKIKIGSQSK